MEKNKKIKYEVLCNTSNQDYYYSYLTKREVLDLESAERKIMRLDRELIKDKKFNQYPMLNNIYIS